MSVSAGLSVAVFPRKYDYKNRIRIPEPEFYLLSDMQAICLMRYGPTESLIQVIPYPRMREKFLPVDIPDVPCSERNPCLAAFLRASTNDPFKISPALIPLSAARPWTLDNVNRNPSRPVVVEEGAFDPPVVVEVQDVKQSAARPVENSVVILDPVDSNSDVDESSVFRVQPPPSPTPKRLPYPKLREEVPVDMPTRRWERNPYSVACQKQHPNVLLDPKPVFFNDSKEMSILSDPIQFPAPQKLHCPLPLMQEEILRPDARRCEKNTFLAVLKRTNVNVHLDSKPVVKDTSESCSLAVPQPPSPKIIESQGNESKDIIKPSKAAGTAYLKITNEEDTAVKTYKISFKSKALVRLFKLTQTVPTTLLNSAKFIATTPDFEERVAVMTDSDTTFLTVGEMKQRLGDEEAIASKLELS